MGNGRRWHRTRYISEEWDIPMLRSQETDEEQAPAPEPNGIEFAPSFGGERWQLQPTDNDQQEESEQQQDIAAEAILEEDLRNATQICLVLGLGYADDEE